MADSGSVARSFTGLKLQNSFLISKEKNRDRHNQRAAPVPPERVNERVRS